MTRSRVVASSVSWIVFRVCDGAPGPDRRSSAARPAASAGRVTPEDRPVMRRKCRIFPARIWPAGGSGAPAARFCARDQIKVIVRNGWLILETRPARRYGDARAAVAGPGSIRDFRNDTGFANKTSSHRIHRRIAEGFMLDMWLETGRIAVLEHDRRNVLTGSPRSGADAGRQRRLPRKFRERKQY
jgi:hypothetical protein